MTSSYAPLAEAASPVPAFNVWLEGLRLGARCLRSDPRIAVERLLLPVSYWRYAEFGYVVRQLRGGRGARVLDLGSPKDLAVFLARRRGYQVWATDILPAAIARSERTARAAGVAGDGPGCVRSEVVDGRQLPYVDDAFDAAYCVSVLEHIPGAGDAQAMRELLRVVRPGGRVVVTTPYAEQYRETFVDRPVYERAGGAPGEQVFFERHYDNATVRQRLIDVPPGHLADFELWGEAAFRGERALLGMAAVRTLLSPLEPVLAKLALRRVDPDGGHAMAAFFTLQKGS